MGQPAGGAGHGEQGEGRVDRQAEAVREGGEQEVDVGRFAGGRFDGQLERCVRRGQVEGRDQRRRARIALGVQGMAKARDRPGPGDATGHGGPGSDPGAFLHQVADTPGDPAVQGP